ncbi:MAG: hypothetical protein ACFE9R_19955, partial [Candidatus Hermodarchaeota archaeon]
RILWEYHSFSLEEKLDILGEMTLRDPEYFMENVYPYRSISFAELSLGLSPLNEFFVSNQEELIKMEEYILKNYCFLGGEEIKTVIHGNLQDKKTITSGRIYLTNYRIIVSGKQATLSAQSGMRQGIVETLIRSGITRHRKAVHKAISQAIRKDLTEWNIGEWGYYFPIYKAKKIKRVKKMVSYILDVETDEKRISIKVAIIPLKKPEQSKQEFQDQRVEALNQVEDLLMHYQ